MNYPEILPMPTRDGYKGAYALQPKRFEMDDGQYRGARQWASQPFRYNLTWQLTTYEQAQIFDAWVEYTLNGGVEFVDIPLLDGTVRCRPVTVTPQFVPNGAGWSVSMQFDRNLDKPVAYAGTANWPATLPQFEKADFQLVPTKGALRSDIETGLPEVRNRFRTRVSTYRGKMLMSLEQRNEFWGFYRDRLQDGFARFNAPFSGPMGSTLVRGKIVESPEETPSGAWFWMAFTMETAEAPIMTLEEYNQAVSTFVNDYCDSDYVVDGYVGYWVIGV